jgi:hypothetical protein
VLTTQINTSLVFFKLEKIYFYINIGDCYHLACPSNAGDQAV